MFKLRSLAVPVLALALVVGCGGGGGNKKTLEDAQAQINTLEAKGVPSSEGLSMAKVHLSNARDNLEKRNNAKAKSDIESMKVELDKAQKFYDENVSTLPPKVDAAKKALEAAKAELSGFQARKVDSTLKVIDSFMRVDRPLQAHSLAQEWMGLRDSLKKDEQKAAMHRRQIPGTWVVENKTVSELISPKDAAVERREFTFGRDGKVQLVESKRGQSGQFFKEDWLFRSWGTYDFKGDTIMLMISRWKTDRQNFVKGILDPNTLKVTWQEEKHPTPDLEITDGSQDRFITVQDLKDDFRKIR